jgi:L-alanine-DL-glutamate epimerase-like enolase superfamily enzyme
MKLNAMRLELPLKHPFTIARSTIDVQSSVIVELEHEGWQGYGEVTEDAFYGHSFDSIVRSLRAAGSSLRRCIEESPQEIWRRLRDSIGDDMFALAVLDQAVNDRHAKRLGIPTWESWGLQWQTIPDSSFTIGIDSIETMVAKLAEEPGWGIYKIKLGTADDLAIIRELRKHTDAVFRVDANCGWSVDETIENSKQLIEYGVEFIEQPLPMGASESEKRAVYERSSLPIIADEDCQVVEDVARCDGLFHGINVKICKCGGLTPALAMLRDARKRGMRTMVGCMVESCIGISGAAQLLPLLDYADLDGCVLLRDHPTAGVEIESGRVTVSGVSGSGGTLDQGRIGSFVKQTVEIEVD